MSEKPAWKASGNQAQDDLPLKHYDSLSVRQIVKKLPDLDAIEVEKLCRYERSNQNRRNVLRHFEERIGSGPATPVSGRTDPPPGEERPEKRSEAIAEPIAREDPPPGEERPGKTRMR